MPSPAQPRSPYDVLGVEPTATLTEIKKARDKLAIQYHPDRWKHPQAQQKMQSINQAYDILSDAVKRAFLDASLRDASRDGTANQSKPSRSWTHEASHMWYGASEAGGTAGSSREAPPMKSRKRAWRERKRNFVFEERERDEWLDVRNRHSYKKGTGPNGGYDGSDDNLPQNDFFRRPMSASQWQHEYGRAIARAGELDADSPNWPEARRPKTAYRQKVLAEKLSFVESRAKSKKTATKARARRRDEKYDAGRATDWYDGAGYEEPDKRSENQDYFLPRDPELFLQAILPEVEHRDELVEELRRERKDSKMLRKPWKRNWKKTKKQRRVAGQIQSTLDANPLRLIERHSGRLAPGSDAWHRERAEAALNQKLWYIQAMRSAAKARLIEDKRADLREIIAEPHAMLALPLRVVRAIAARRRAIEGLPPVQRDTATSVVPSLALISAPPSNPSSALVPTPASDTALVARAKSQELTVMQAELDEMQLAKIRGFEEKHVDVNEPGYLGDLVSRARARLAERPKWETYKDQRFWAVMQGLDRQVKDAYSQEVQARKTKEDVAHRLYQLGARSDIIRRARNGRQQRARDLADAALWLDEDERDLFTEGTASLDAKLHVWAFGREDYVTKKHIDLSDPSLYMRADEAGKITATRNLPEPGEFPVPFMPWREKRRGPKSRHVVRESEIYFPCHDEALKHRVMESCSRQAAGHTDLILKGRGNAVKWGSKIPPNTNRAPRNPDIAAWRSSKEYSDAIHGVIRQWAGLD